MVSSSFRSPKPQSALSKLQEQVLRLERRVTYLQDDLEKMKEENKRLQDEVSEKDRRIKELEEALQCKEEQRRTLAATIFKAGRSRVDSKPVGKKVGATGYARPEPNPSAITSTHTFSLGNCPECGGPVGSANRMTCAYTEDIVMSFPRVEKYAVTRHWCGRCHKHQIDPRAPDLTRIRRIGIQTLVYILYARYHLDLTIPKTQSSLKNLYYLSLSEGEIVNQLKEARDLFGNDYLSICELIREAAVVHADETGMRVMGHNWWLWVGVTPEGITKFQIHHSRGKGAARCLLGEHPLQVRVTDFYNAYYHLPGPHQVCWIHVLRDAKELHGQLHADLVGLYHELKVELVKPVHERVPTIFKKKLETIACTSYTDDKPVRTLQARMLDFKEELLTCLSHEGVPPENNQAERALRPQVIKRKIFGSIRSLEGAITHETNSSVLTTYKNLGGPFFEVIPTVLKARLEAATAA